MDDLVSDLKNFDWKYKFPCMYSGFVTVDQPTNSNLFYWFFRSEGLESKAPLVLWLNGGPGSSSQIGNLIENGPLKLVKDRDGITRVHSLTGQAWNAVANVVFVDQPVGVGYSYGAMNITESKQLEAHAIKFLLGFYRVHPEMKGRDFFITGESYGGKYEPGIASAIIDHNKNASDDEKIPLKGVLIGNGFTDPIVQRLSIRHLSLALGSIQFDSIPELDIIEKRCQEANGRKDIQAPNICGNVSGFISKMDGGMDMYDSRWPASNDTVSDILTYDYLNDAEVVTQLHCEKSDKVIKYSLSNETVGDNYIGDGMLRYIDQHQKILDNNITLVIFVGQFDRKDGPYGVQEWMKKLKWDGMKDFYASSRNLYYYVSDDNNEVRLGGNFKSYKNLNVLMIYAAGHMVPSTQLATSRSMLSDIITNGTLLCHERDGKCSLDETTCNLMNNCTGHGQCITGKCKCDAGFYGGDCSITTTSLAAGTISLNATTWAYFTLGSQSDIKAVTATSANGEFYVYTRKGNVPSQTFFEWFLQGVDLQFVLSAQNSGDFIAFFNPDFDKSINISVKLVESSSSEEGLSALFWLFLAIAVVLAILSSINVVYFFRLRKNRQKMLNLAPENASEYA